MGRTLNKGLVHFLGGCLTFGIYEAARRPLRLRSRPQMRVSRIEEPGSRPLSNRAHLDPRDPGLPHCSAHAPRGLRESGWGEWRRMDANAGARAATQQLRAVTRAMGFSFHPRPRPSTRRDSEVSEEPGAFPSNWCIAATTTGARKIPDSRIVSLPLKTGNVGWVTGARHSEHAARNFSSALPQPTVRSFVG